MKNAKDTKGHPFKGIRWKPIVIWLGLLSCIEISYHYYHDGKDSTLQGFAFVVYSVTALISVLVWWLFISGVSLKLKGLGLLGIAFLAVIFRVDGFRGDLMPRLAFRWSSDKPNYQSEPVNNSHLNLTNLTFEGYILNETDWPGYRGTGRDGIAQGIGFQDSWLQPRELWRIDVGEGWSSFISVGKLCWTQGLLGSDESVTAYDTDSGAKIWQHTDPVRFDETFGGPGPRATPVYENGRLWTLGGTGVLNCFDAATGELHWTKDILADNNAPNIEWGMTASPLLHGDFIIVLPGGTNNSSLVAYDKLNGKKKWSGGDSIASYSSPQVSILDGVQQIIVHNGLGLAGHSLEDGKVLWDFPWTTMSKVNVAQPIIHSGNQVLTSSGYTVGAVNLQVTPKDGKWEVKQLWKSRWLKAKFNTMVAIGKHVYGLDEGIMTCLDMETGKRVWKGGRYGYGQFILAGDAFVVLSEKGEVVFVRATPENFQEIGKFKALDGKTWQHPIIANGRLFLRNSRQAVCYQLGHE